MITKQGYLNVIKISNKKKREEIVMKTITEEKEKIGIGARRLSETEIRKILPTYDTLLKQIEGFKQIGSQYTKDTLKEESKEQGIFGLPQVTNNISIIGPRGAGKTSVMKSLFYELSKKDSNGNVSHILLPPIVPENMPDSMDLLSNILGLLGKRVGECTEKEKKERESSLCFYEKPELECLYEDVVQYFGYLKSDYKEQVKKENLTESSHIDKNIKLFTSNYKFVEVFYQFIYKLLEYEKKELLFLFIDDVDLSTYRCMDIVQTLLSYISHPRIVTILSGDLDTFEEALTLEFLRQEKMPDSSSFDNNYIRDGKGEDDTLIRRKNILAYEYLKKIMPPLYRHRIAEWGLEKRGEFIVGGDTDKGDNDSNTTLLELLEGLEVYNKEKLKNYFAISTDNGKKIIPQMFHMFDNVARGLNNVAHVLKQKPNIEEKTGNQEEDNENAKKQEYLYKKTILETVLFSNKILNANREVILNDVLVLGEDEDSTYISFENLYSAFAIEDLEKNENNKKMVQEYEKKAKTYVTVFLYCDWAWRLLNFDSIVKTVEYNIAQKEALIYFLLYPTLSGKTKILKKEFGTLYCIASGMEKEKNNVYKYMIQSYFLFDFQQAVAFLEYCDILECYEEILLKQEKVDKEKEIILYIQFYYFLTFYCEEINKGMYDISIYLQIHIHIIQKIQEVFYIDANRTLIRELVREYYVKKATMKRNLYIIYEICLELRYRSYYLLQNLSHGKYIYNDLLEYFKVNLCENYLTRDILWNKIEEINIDKETTYRLKNEEASKYTSNRFSHEKPFYNYFYYLIFEKYGNSECDIKDILLKEPKTEGDELKRCKIIMAINESKMWNDVLSEEIIQYIIKQIGRYEKDAIEKLLQKSLQIKYNSNIIGKIKSIVNTPDFDNYLDGNRTFKSVNTVWGQCQILIGKILEIEKEEQKAEELYHISLYSYILLIDVLNRIIHSTAWTGRIEAREIEKWLETGIWDIEGAIENEASEKGKSEIEELLELYRFYFLAYCKIEVANMNPELWNYLSSAKECLDSIEYSHDKLADEKGEEYRKKIASALEVDGEVLSFDDIRELFS